MPTNYECCRSIPVLVNLLDYHLSVWQEVVSLAENIPKKFEMFFRCDNFTFYLLLVLHIAIGLVMLHFINIIEPLPYVDEFFHVNQCQEYCKGNFQKYDPKITTPPGLYIITVSVIVPLSKLLNIDLCTLSVLRLVSFTASVLIFMLIHRILQSRVYYSNVKKQWLALNCTIFPVLYFMSFFYYTDVISTFLVLLTYYLYSINQSHSAGFVGLLSVTVRQNNIVWFFYFAFNKCCKNIDNEMNKTDRRTQRTDKYKVSYVLVILGECFHIFRRSFLTFLLMILKETYFLLISLLCLIYLISKNGSLVLGDKSAHEAVIHIPQLFYFSLFTAVFSFPLCIYPSIELFRNFRNFKRSLLLYTLLITAVVSVNTMAHLFLISDNRHYTFYIWKRVYEKPFGRYIPVPLYIISIYCIVKNLSHMNGCVKLGYLISTIICLVPHKLLEFRYFIVPYLLYRIETSCRLSWWQLMLEFIFNVVVNYKTINLFLTSPFTWSDGTIQRFSW